MKKYFLIILGLFSFVSMFAGITLIFGANEDRFWQDWLELGGPRLLPLSSLSKFGIFLIVMIFGFIFIYCLDTIPKLFKKKNKRLTI